jgi:hypothetical protein
MSDVSTFISAIGIDVNTVVGPQIDGLANEIQGQALANYGPKISTFASQLVKEIVAEQSIAIKNVVATLIQDVCARYQPQVAGQLRAKIVNGGIELVGEGVRLDLKRRDTGAVVSSLDIPVSVTIPIAVLSLNLTETTVALNVLP